MGTDTIVYFVLLSVLGHNVAKTISFISGSIVAFLINKFYTFEQHLLSWQEVVRFAVLYISTLFANVAVNAGVLWILTDWVKLAFLMATGTSTVLNFLGQKFWVFKK